MFDYILRAAMQGAEIGNQVAQKIQPALDQAISRITQAVLREIDRRFLAYRNQQGATVGR
jgi:hypothetical protein